MRTHLIPALLLALPAAAPATQAIEVPGHDHAVAFFTSGLVNGEPVDRIDTASLDQDCVILYVDWGDAGTRSFRTEVRITDPDGDVVGTIRNTVRPARGGYHTYYYFRPRPDDTPGNWSYSMYIDGLRAFEARIPLLAAD